MVILIQREKGGRIVSLSRASVCSFFPLQCFLLQPNWNITTHPLSSSRMVPPSFCVVSILPMVMEAVWRYGSHSSFETTLSDPCQISLELWSEPKPCTEPCSLVDKKNDAAVCALLIQYLCVHVDEITVKRQYMGSQKIPERAMLPGSLHCGAWHMQRILFWCLSSQPTFTSLTLHLSSWLHEKEGEGVCPMQCVFRLLVLRQYLLHIVLSWSFSFLFVCQDSNTLQGWSLISLVYVWCCNPHPPIGAPCPRLAIGLSVTHM